MQLEAQQEDVEEHPHVAGDHRRERGGDELAHVELSIGQRCGEQWLQAAPFLFADEGLQGDDEGEGAGEEANDEDEEGKEPLHNQRRPVLVEELQSLRCDELGDEGEGQNERGDRCDDAPIAQGIDDLAADDERDAAPRLSPGCAPGFEVSSSLHDATSSVVAP